MIEFNVCLQCANYAHTEYRLSASLPLVLAFALHLQCVRSRCDCLVRANVTRQWRKKRRCENHDVTVQNMTFNIHTNESISCELLFLDRYLFCALHYLPLYHVDISTGFSLTNPQNLASVGMSYKCKWICFAQTLSSLCIYR